MNGVPVVIDPWLAPDMFVSYGGGFRAGSVEAVERVVEAYNARPWWQKVNDECDAYDVVQAKLAAMSDDIVKLANIIHLGGQRFSRRFTTKTEER